MKVDHGAQRPFVRTLAFTMLFAFMMLPSGGAGSETGTRPKPFATAEPPPKDVYDGPLFKVSHDYPRRAKRKGSVPWRQAIDFGSITRENAGAYVEALKDFVADDMEEFLFHPENWNPRKRGWYNQPWLSTVRDPIRGTMAASVFGGEMFPLSGLTGEMQTHVLVYYDSVAAVSLGRVWGKKALYPIPGLERGGAQFDDTAIIVKPAFTTASGELWPPIEGAFKWQIYAAPPGGSPSAPQLLDVYLFQLDIIVKDEQSAPETGWVFSTLVYDRSVEGSDWDRMVPLGAMWGNDPEVISSAGCDYLVPGDCPELYETWINEDTPVYSRETLGWGGRLSGPNDGAVDLDAAVLEEDGSVEKFEGRFAMSSCMGCHSTAEYEMGSFLLPTPPVCNEGEDFCAPTQTSDGSIVYYEPGSDEFMRFFQNRNGEEPINDGKIALDYGLQYAFQALPHWQNAMGVDSTPKIADGFGSYQGHWPWTKSSQRMRWIDPQMVAPESP